MKEIAEYVYRKHDNKPRNTKLQNFLFHILRIPYIDRFVIPILLKVYNLPASTTINRNFLSTAPLLKLGNNVGLADTFIVAWAPITIGENTTFSYKNSIITSTHDLMDFSIVIGKPIVIGSNSWITSNCTILGGVTIGSNTIIGAGSVVTSDIPSGVFAVGNPCKVIKEIQFKK